MLDCIIAGGGVAGLAAARILTDAGVSWKLLEARQRLGGRVHTVSDAAGHPVELGAEFVHGEATEIRELSRAGGLTLVPTESSFMSERSRVFRSDDSWWDDVATVADRARSDGPDRTVNEFLASLRDVPPSIRERARGFFESFDAADTNELSEHSISGDTGAASETSRIAEGYSSVVDVLHAMTDRGSIMTSARVRRIVWRAGRVTAVVEDGSELTARVAIVALPLHVLLPGNGVVWDPEPRILQQLTAAVRPGHVARVTLAFDEPFWLSPRHRARFESDPSRLGFFTLADSSFSTWWNVGARPHLVAWNGGPPARELLADGVETVKRRAVAELENVFGALPDCSAHSYDWSSDPLSGMAYSWIPAGGLECRPDMRAPVSETVLFCGEALAPEGQIGTVDGAMASGYRAARQAIDLLEREPTQA